MVVVHHLENSRSQRVLWLLEELGVPYEVKRYARNKETMLAPPGPRRFDDSAVIANDSLKNPQSFSSRNYSLRYDTADNCRVHTRLE